MEEILKNIYDISSAAKLYRNKTNFIKSLVGSGTYGELTQKGVDAVVSKFKKYFNSETVFYDLGSGLGKMVTHVGVQYGIKKSVGIEYSKERHECALYIKENYLGDYNNIEFICGDFNKVGFSDATVIYMDNTAYPDAISEKIYEGIPSGCLLIYKRNRM